MTGSQTLLARTALGTIAAVASVALTSSSRLRGLSRERFDRATVTAFAVSRLVFFFVLFVWFGATPRGDVPAYYLQQAQFILQGQLPYRDFLSSYAPLHPYLDAALLLLWHTPLSLMLFAVLAELLILPVWFQVGRTFLSESEVRIAALLYLASPISLQFVAVDGQDNVVIALLLALSLLLILRGRNRLSGAALGLSIAAIKFLPLLYAPAFFLASRRRWRWAAGAAGVVALVYGGFLLRHAPILQPLSAEGDLRSAGDLPYLMEAIFGVSIPVRLPDLLVLLVLIAVFALVARASHNAPPPARIRAISFGISALTLEVLLLSKKSWPPYLMLSLFPICALAAAGSRSRLRVGAFAVFSLVAVIEHSVWSSWLEQFSSTAFRSALLAHNPQALLFLGLQLLLISGYAWLLMESIHRLAAVPGPVEPEVEASPALEIR
ncbi:MAG TPA: glycosyltransferase 87 family protein [Granulicella sp.]|nr:glycosyltransferase 87 family protein [Granulicella sp.]